jgi:hypothetical protein
MDYGKCSGEVEDWNFQQHIFKDRHACGHDNTMCGQGFLEWQAGLVVSINPNY